MSEPKSPLVIAHDVIMKELNNLPLEDQNRLVIHVLSSIVKYRKSTLETLNKEISMFSNSLETLFKSIHETV